jgi:predicted  nucleic acid-binding Zn-ribbon protein
LTEQRSTREYAALAREIDIAKKSNVTMAEELAEMGKTQGTQRDAVKTKDLEFSQRSKDLATKMGELRAKLAEAESGIKGLEEKRAAAAQRVDATLLRRYDAVRKKRMPAMVPLHAPNTCTGCRMNVPPQLYNTLKATLGFDTCPSCMRIIHAPEAVEPQVK